MAIKLTNIQRENPLPCQHFTLTFDIDGATRVISGVSETDLDNSKDQVETILIGILAWYYKRKGLSAAQILNKNLLSDVL